MCALFGSVNMATVGWFLTLKEAQRQRRVTACTGEPHSDRGSQRVQVKPTQTEEGHSVYRWNPLRQRVTVCTGEPHSDGGGSQRVQVNPTQTYSSWNGRHLSRFFRTRVLLSPGFTDLRFNHVCILSSFQNRNVFRVCIIFFVHNFFGEFVNLWIKKKTFPPYTPCSTSKFP